MGREGEGQQQKDAWPGFPVGEVPGHPKEAGFTGQCKGQKQLG